MKELMPVEMIERKIYLIRGHRVLLDSDLAELYGWKPSDSMNRFEGIRSDFRMISCFSLQRRNRNL